MIKAVLVLFALLAVALASHGRYGNIKFSKNPSNPREVTFEFNAAFRRTYFGAPNVGSVVYDDVWRFGDGSTQSIPMLVKEVDTTLDLIVVQWVGTHTYAGAGTYLAGWISCCRIFALNNNPSYSYAHTATVVLTATEISTGIVNNSPTTGFAPILKVDYGVTPYIYFVTASDPENQGITWSQATTTQQGDGSSVHPPGMTLNTATGEVRLNTVLAKGYWTTQQIITDAHGNWISIDYLLDVQQRATFCNGLCSGTPNPICVDDADCVTCNTTCIDASPRLITADLSASAPTPRTNLPSPANQQTFNRNVGQQVVVNYVADDENLRNPQTPVQITFSATPAGSSTPPQVPCDAANGCSCVDCNGLPQLRTLTWTPTAADIGGNTVCVQVKSQGNDIPFPNNPWCITINVIAAPITSGALTTEALTTDVILSTGSLTTSFATVAARCATYTFPETQGYFCAADGSGYYQCLKGPWAPQANFRPCAAGTSCKCPVGVECSAQGICTFGPWNGPY